METHIKVHLDDKVDVSSFGSDVLISIYGVDTSLVLELPKEIVVSSEIFRLDADVAIVADSRQPLRIERWEDVKLDGVDGVRLELESSRGDVNVDDQRLHSYYGSISVVVSAAGLKTCLRSLLHDEIDAVDASLVAICKAVSALDDAIKHIGGLADEEHIGGLADEESES